MTTSTSAHDPLETWRRPIRISDPADLMAALPALLGFHPERSLIVVLLCGDSGKSLGAVMRHDVVLPQPAEFAAGIPAEPVAAAIDQFAVVCGREAARAAIVIFVDDRAEFDGDGLMADAFDDIVGTIYEQLSEVGTEVVGAHVTGAVEGGQDWWSLLGDPRSGRLPDPYASSITAAHVLEGRQIRGSRGELEALLSPGELTERLLIAELIDEAAISDRIRSDLAARKPDPATGSRRLLERVLWQIATVGSGETLLAPEIAELGLALSDRLVRDSVMALAVGESRDAAEQLWVLLARMLPDPLRAEPAMLLGYSAYVSGDGPLAGVALSAALDADPQHSLASMFDTALQHGMHPEKLRELADTGYECARALGMELPPPTNR